MTLLQTSLLENQKLAVKDLLGHPEQKSAPAKQALEATAVETASVLAPVTTELPFDTPSILARLVSVMKEIGSMDAMVVQAEAGAPKCPEARKWHEVSMTALVWSRQNLAKEQRALLQKLKERCLAQRAAEPSPVPTTVCYQKLGAQGPPSAAAPAADNARVVGSLRSDLRRVQELDDPQRCLLVRKIKKLGLESAQKLQSHFQRAGGVTEVLVAHSFEKPSAKRRQGRIRPAAMGFVVMESGAVARALVDSGEVQFVQDGEELVEVTVEHFDPSMASLQASYYEA